MRLILLMVTCLILGSNGWGQWTNPVLLPPPINVNPPGEYYYSTISADGQVLCLTISPSGFGDDDVWFSERIGDSAWTVPVNAGPNVNNNQRNLSPSITNDRQRLYYVSYTGSYDIMVSYRTGPDWDDWSVGEPLPQPINMGMEFTATIAGDDSTLTFQTNALPGDWHGFNVLAMSRLQEDGSWSEPILIGPFPTPYLGGIHPSLTDSGNTLVYSRWSGLNQQIYYSHRDGETFGNEIPCDSTINTAYWEGSPSAPWDGSYMIFDARRDSSIGLAARLYVAQRMPNASPERPNPLPQQGDIQIYPNPGDSQTLFRVMLPNVLRGTPLTVYNVIGQRVLQIESDPYETISYILLQGGNHATGVLPAGRYFVAATSPRGQAVGTFTICR